MDKNTGNINRGLPPQKISVAKKTKEWKEQCVTSIISMGSFGSSLTRSTPQNKQINYNLVNSIFDEEDIKYVLDPYNQGSKAGRQPAKMRSMNLIVSKLNLLKGEEMSRPFSHRVISLNGEAVSAKEDKRKELLFKVSLQKIAEELGVSLEPEIDPETGEPIPVEFSQVDKFLSYSHTDIREKWANSILQYLKHKEKLSLKFNQGWEHCLISGEEIYYVGIVNGEPKLRVVNPLNCEFDRNPDDPCIENGDWFKEDRNMTAGQILDEYGEYLTDAQVSELDSGNLLIGAYSNIAGTAYSPHAFNKYKGELNSAAKGHYLVSSVAWKSMKKIGFVTYPSETGELDTGIVDESFVITKEMKDLGYSVEWRWISEWWQGTRISADIFVKIEPVPNQSRMMDNPGEVKGPYIGRTYNATNSSPTSLVDLIKPHQYLYNVIWFRLEAEIAKAKGKKMVMDIAQIPKSEGFDVDKWMYYFDNVGIAFVNSFEEGKEGTRSQGQTSNFNQFTAIDMTLSASVGQYINILSKIEIIVDKIVGISAQREGAIHQSETASGVERSLAQSSLITEPWFYMHNETKTQVLSQLLETAKLAYVGKKKLHYIVDDMERISVEIDMEKFADSEYGVFVTNSTQDTVIFNKLQSLIPQGMQTGIVSLSDAIAMFKSQSVAELGNLIKDSEKKRKELEQQQSSQQNEMQQQMIVATAEEKERERQFVAEQNQLDRESSIQKATISVASFDSDTEDNGVIDVFQQSKLILDESKESNKSSLDRLKLSHETSEKDKDRKLKEKEIASKERIEHLKSETALKNKTAGEK